MDKSKHTKLGILGVGTKCEALIAAILKSGIDASSIANADKRVDRLTKLQKKYGCSVSRASEIAPTAKNVLLVVKPKDMDSLLKEIGNSLSSSQRVISFVTGKKRR